ncbi:MAG: DUF423 domain-containing protein [Rhodobacteraceae bacterium]|nr:DUF423 domain-containing protein [Paracoccaceae bacterium]
MTLRRSTAAFFIFGALAAGSSVALAAYATHALLESQGMPFERVRTFLDATEFQFNQGIGILVIAVVGQLMADGWTRRIVQLSGVLACASILLFPISVYNSVLGGSAALAPIGGTSSMLGWALFAVAGAIGLFRGELKLPASGHPQPAE